MKKFLVLAVFLAACSSENKRMEEGAGIGAAAGAVLGGIVGNQMGHNTAAGALIGAAAGGFIGGHMGHRLDEQAKELQRIAETKRTDQGLVSKLKSDILFDTGKANLKPTAQDNMKQMAEIIKKYPEDILTVKGYTDSTGSAKVNEKLSKDRAEAVKAALAANGVPAATISTVGMGPASPVADNKSAAGRAKNRRVEIEVTIDESKVPKEKK